MGQAAEVMCTDIAAPKEWVVRPMVALRIADCETVVPKRASARLSSYVIVDRTWAQALGVPGLRRAQRVGKFYRVPRAEFMRLVAAHFDADITSGLKWTESDACSESGSVTRSLGRGAELDRLTGTPTRLQARSSELIDHGHG